MKMKKVSSVTIVILSLLLGVQSFAQSQYRDKKINTRKLVDDYWTPSAKKYSLIQQRYFVKSNRPMISLGGGFHVNNPQHEGFMTQLSAGYFLSEKWGFEAQYTKSMLNGNDLIKLLDSEVPGGSSTLDRTKTLDYVGGAILYSPIYGKMSLLGYKILYYDLILSGQLGQTKYEQTLQSNSPTASALTFGIGITQLFYLNKHISLRVDFNNRWYNAEVLKYNTSGQKLKDRTINDTQLSLGLSFML
jgi:outer membrane beta-barrel protein